MTTDEFKSAQLRLGLTNAKMARLLCCSLTHLENLRRGYKRESGRRIDVLPTAKDVRIIEQAEVVGRLEKVNEKMKNAMLAAYAALQNNKPDPAKNALIVGLEGGSVNNPLDFIRCVENWKAKYQKTV